MGKVNAKTKGDRALVVKLKNPVTARKKTIQNSTEDTTAESVNEIVDAEVQISKNGERGRKS